MLHKVSAKGDNPVFVRLQTISVAKYALHVTSTYSAKYLPATVEDAEKEVSNFLRRVAYARKKAGLPPLKYISRMKLRTVLHPLSVDDEAGLFFFPAVD